MEGHPVDLDYGDIEEHSSEHRPIRSKLNH